MEALAGTRAGGHYEAIVVRPDQANLRMKLDRQRGGRPIEGGVPFRIRVDG